MQEASVPMPDARTPPTLSNSWRFWDPVVLTRLLRLDGFKLQQRLLPAARRCKICVAAERTLTDRSEWRKRRVRQAAPLSALRLRIHLEWRMRRREHRELLQLYLSSPQYRRLEEMQSILSSPQYRRQEEMLLYLSSPQYRRWEEAQLLQSSPGNRRREEHRQILEQAGRFDPFLRGTPLLERLAEDWPFGGAEQAIPQIEGPPSLKGEDAEIAAEAPAAPGLLPDSEPPHTSVEPEADDHMVPPGTLDSNLESSFRRKRGRPAKIDSALKEKALKVEGGKARAQILYQTHYPTPQQVKNVSAILRHYKKSRPSTEG